MAMVIGEQPSAQVLQLPQDCELDCNGASKQCRYFAVGNSTIPLVNNVKALPDCNIPSGAKSVQGRRPNLEDCYTVEDNFITLHICNLPSEAIIPQALQSQEGIKQLVPTLQNSVLYSSSSELSDVSSNGSDITVEAYNNIGEDIRRISSNYQYAAVFDGHGGSAVSMALAESLHPILRKELEEANASGRNLMTIHNIADGLKNSFLRMNSLLGNEAKTAGSTGVVSLISSDHIIVANCGDSRAVLWRNQQAFKLSRDHKPNHPDEQERVVRAGGKVCNYNGIRVMGLLAMTRAFGDHCLSNFGIIAEPEVTIIERQVDDEFVILASDGLWDVISDMEACALASRCFMRAQERNASRDTAARVAASVLIHVALEKGSSDNITVVVLDLRK